MVILPMAILLILRVWWKNGWELRGTWWGLLLVFLAFVPTIFSEQLVFFWSMRGAKVNFFPHALPAYLYASGIVLLFAGVRVWKRAWFPLALLLFVQPIPQVVVNFLDLPMQGVSAHIARSFAVLLGLSLTNVELLRLMFAPNFGMFIAPGCDGMRGALTMAYGALIAGYLKRVSISKWIMYVVGAFLLGHVFNLLRLCALVLYYKIALGHPVLEHLAKRADYMIGGMLFLVAAFVFLWMVSGKVQHVDVVACASPSRESATDRRLTYLRLAALALLAIAAIIPSVHATSGNSESLVSDLHRGKLTVQDLNDQIPSLVGDYRLVRTWQEQIAGVPSLEAAAFATARPDEIEIGIWLPPDDHSIQASLMTQGELPKIKAIREFTTAGGKSFSFNTALYDDGVTDILTGDTYCSPSACEASIENAEGIHLALANVMDHSTRGKRLVPIFFKLQVPRTRASDEAVYSQLSSECQDFLSHLDFRQLSQRFQ
jgi:exosortase J